MALLRVKDLTIDFPTPTGYFRAVDHVSFRIKHGETLCLVGESGSGKSMIARAVMGLVPEAALATGSILYEGEPLHERCVMQRGHVQSGRGMAMIFQEPMAALNPSMKVEQLVGEAWRLRSASTPERTRERVCEVLEQTGIASPQELLATYPWQLSGGLAQRVLIAASLILQPRLLIADEPTTALDVTTQAQILRVLVKLRTESKLALLFITHDLSIASLMGGDTLVLHRGRAVERGTTAQVLSEPRHAYTRNLLACTPGVALRDGRRRLSPVRGGAE